MSKTYRRLEKDKLKKNIKLKKARDLKKTEIILEDLD